MHDSVDESYIHKIKQELIQKVETRKFYTYSQVFN